MKMKESEPRRGRPERPLESINGNSLFFPFLIFIMIKSAKPMWQIRKRLDQLRSKKVHRSRQQDWDVF